ncbi:LacI family DNA-binding transcriptional regulator [Paenibacillus sp. JX-17]|uniref:LacI family DNA-binding transcriptional regulator n=1 Tax=Paenibacillus lacisoli TaxID=3064525 RepID=A0ABT9CIA2_9BACL|nr:LacI family DNA-binding transcriptional regulator [Paenibacillus sp. JX-17]MDO7907348.1 LacI family DNA-binding transcriptional regulator [Paenibacillus sp. JX-17]
MASIHDVAKHAGVSVATVSKVINNYPDVSDKTRKKVNKAIDHLRYQPNVVARGLVKRRSWTVGVLLTVPFTNPFVSELLEGIKTALENSGYDLVRLSTRFDDPNYSFLKHCRSRNVDGVVVFGVDKDNRGVDELIHSDLPTMFVDTDQVGKRAGYITTDNHNAIRMAVSHLSELGHRKIAYISGTLGPSMANLRLEGYRAGIRESGLEYNPSYMEVCDYSFDGGSQAARKLLELPNPPTGIICASDMSAFGAIQEIERHGLSVPEDISVIGFDNTYYAQVFKPGLTTVNQNIFNIGVRSIEFLIAMVENAEYSPPVIMEPSHLVIRHTTAKVQTV